MAKHFLIWLFAALLLSACAGARVAPPQPDPRVAALVEEAGTALDAITEDTLRFYADMGKLRGKLTELTSRPEWPEMEAIILATPSALLLEGDYVDGDYMEDMGSSGEVKEWVRKWNQPWEPIFQDYVSLSDRCSILEARRTALKSRITEVQVRYLVAAEAEELVGRVEQARSLIDTVDVLSESVNELDSFTLSKIGFYSVSPM